MADRRAAYELEGFLDGAACDALIERAGEIVRRGREPAASRAGGWIILRA